MISAKASHVLLQRMQARQHVTSQNVDAKCDIREFGPRASLGNLFHV